jgi:Lipid A 3-O-deacylase (PagL)
MRNEGEAPGPFNKNRLSSARPTKREEMKHSIYSNQLRAAFRLEEPSVRPFGVVIAISLLVLFGVLNACPANAENEPAQSGNESDFNPLALCPKCKLLVGAGQTYQFWGWSDGVVLPVTLEIDESRWELGVFRVATRQIAIGHGYPPPDYTSATPFWGYSAMRRWQFLHRSWLRLYAGVGGSYKSEIDTLDATRLNFSYLLAARFDLGASGALFEVAVRHWSNAYIKRPNIGENFLTLSFSY